jgi:hypothetical protein
MKFWKLFILYVAAISLIGSSTLWAQLSDIPIKPGLWETHVTAKIAGSNHDADAKTCFTAGTTMSDYLTASNKSAPGTQCTASNKVHTAHEISYDTVCSGGSMSSKGHIDVQLADAEHFSGSSNTTVTGSGRNMEIDKIFTGKFLASDCGDVKPMVAPAK